MDNIFEFSDIKKSEETMNSTWAEFRKALVDREFCYSQINVALEKTFLKVFDQLIADQTIRSEYSVSLLELVKIRNAQFFRGAIIEPGEMVDYDRFIPKKEFIKEDRRFSPPGIEWLYLSIQDTSMTHVSPNLAQECCIKECCASNGDDFAICPFRTDVSNASLSIIDLTIGIEDSFESLNRLLDTKAQEIRSLNVKRFFETGKLLDGWKLEFETHFKLWASHTYTKLLAEQIFEPVITRNKNLNILHFNALHSTLSPAILTGLFIVVQFVKEQRT